MNDSTPLPPFAPEDDILAWAAANAWREEEAAALPMALTRPPRVGTVGTLEYSEPESALPHLWPRWKITGSPHAVMMARKLFSAESDERSHLSISFPATLGNFEELLLLMHRFPLALEGDAAVAFERFYRIAIAERAINIALPAVSGGVRYFRGKLLPFQVEGVAFLAQVRKALLADDMGLGKTVMAFSFLDRVGQWPAAIVMQSHVQRHWEKKLPEFMAAEPAGVGGLDYRAHNKLRFTSLNGGKRLDGTPQAQIYLVHYLVLHAWAEFLIERGVKTVVFDECQELRHPGTRKHDACSALARAADSVIGLSGTPIYNHGIEIHHVLNTLQRGCLGTKAAFERDWCGYVGGKVIVTQPETLGQYLRDRRLMLRRRKDEVKLELPAKRRVVEPIDADAAIFAELVRHAAELARQAAEIADPFDRARMEQEAIRETRRATALAKLPAVIAFLRGLMEAGEPTLCFTHHHATVDGICEALEEFAPARITGREDKAGKDESQRRFVAGDTDLCLIALRTATGLDGLQARARVVVFAELDWSPAVHRQAEDRAHRMGQRDSVLVYYLVTDLGTDPFVMMTLNLKESQFTGLMHDRAESEEDRAVAEAAAKTHMASVLDMLRAGRAA
jgi:SNF2 family DNA or RNA helicase